MLEHDQFYKRFTALNVASDASSHEWGEKNKKNPQHETDLCKTAEPFPSQKKLSPNAPQYFYWCGSKT